MNLKEYLREISVPVFLAVCVFAISSWIDINGVWVEVPLMVNELPEGWNLPSYLVIIIQIANVGPIIFTIAKKFAPTKVQEWWVIYVIIGIGMAACFLLIFFWDATTYVSGTEHSTALLVLTMFLALVDCTSSVVFLPYMAQFISQYLSAFYVGEGLSGLIPAIIGLIQGVGKDPTCVNSTDPASNGTGFIVVPVYEPPLFSVNVFFGILFVLLCFSGAAFTLLHFHPKFRCHRITVFEIAAELDDSSAERPNVLHRSDDSPSSTIGATYINLSCEGETSAEKAEKVPNTTEKAESRDSQRASPAFSVLSCSNLTLLILVGWINALTNGVLPSIQSYSCLPYGNLAYNLAVRLSVLANPLACFCGLFVQVRSTAVCLFLAVIGTALAGYQIALAALSPYPPLYDQTAGAALAVSTFVLLTAIFSYVKMTIANMLSVKGGAGALLWCGGFTQIGSCLGAIVTFVLVNVVKLFTSKYPCT